MARIWGVDNARVFRNGPGWYNPQGHKGLDVFSKPGNRAHVPLGCTLELVNATYGPRYKAQAFGWITMCDERFGIAIAHMAAKPRLGRYREGELIGTVASGTRTPKGGLATPHIHFALGIDSIPPPGEVNPYTKWLRCVRAVTQGAAPEAVDLAEEYSPDLGQFTGDEGDEEEGNFTPEQADSYQARGALMGYLYDLVRSSEYKGNESIAIDRIEYTRSDELYFWVRRWDGQHQRIRVLAKDFAEYE